MNGGVDFDSCSGAGGNADMAASCEATTGVP